MAVNVEETFELLFEKKNAVAYSALQALQREAGKQTLQAGIGTRSQQALQLQREVEKRRMFELKQQKRKEKHRVRQVFCLWRIWPNGEQGNEDS